MPEKKKRKEVVEEETSSPSSSWTMFFTPNSKPNLMTCPGLTDMVVWLRLVIGLLYGISLGTRGQVGGVGMMMGVNLITFLPILYMNFYLGAESYPSFTGLPNAIALMLLVWIIFFTIEHTQDEEALVASLKSAVTQTATATMSGNPDSSSSITPDSTTSVPIPPTETEF